ncbi:MAG: 1-phosphofructokinase [Tetrasphaera sp.]|jgi:1-phosphofructokinase|nr:1-phosphofructokinase [Tetrasphaera sp.]
MIVTLTPNPSIDRTIAVDTLDRGEVHRATSSRVDPGGKGVNVARALSAQGGSALAILPVGGPEGRLMEALLDSAGVPTRLVPVAGTLRMNVAVVEPDGTTTKLNEPGPSLSAGEIEGLLAATTDAAASAAWVVGCGSLPPQAPTHLYAALVASVRPLGARVAIDSSGAPLAAAVAARPHLIKPNHEELAELVGHPLATLGDVRDAARDLISSGIEMVAVSLGKDGALLVTADDLLHGSAQITTRLSTVGAGDCMLAGLLHALAAGAPPERALATAVTWGSAAVTLPGSRVPTPEDLIGIPAQVTADPDLSLRLTS